MTVLSYPTPYDERRYSSLWCGQSVIADWATDWRQSSVLPSDVDHLIPASQKGSFGTTLQGLVMGARALGLPVSDPIAGPMASYWPACLDRSHRCCVLHQCNGYAQPVRSGSSNIAHYRDGFGWDGQNTATMNPWGGINETISRSTMESADLQWHIEFLEVMPKDRGVTPPVIETEENSMVIRSTDSNRFDIYAVDNNILIHKPFTDGRDSTIPFVQMPGRWKRLLGGAYYKAGEIPGFDTPNVFIGGIGLDNRPYYFRHDLISGKIIEGIYQDSTGASFS